MKREKGGGGGFGLSMVMRRVSALGCGGGSQHSRRSGGRKRMHCTTLAWAPTSMHPNKQWLCFCLVKPYFNVAVRERRTELARERQLFPAPNKTLMGWAIITRFDPQPIMGQIQE